MVYAIGEILLVVIGILIALQINNWNQERLNSKEEMQLLELIHQEMDQYLFLQGRGTERQENIIRATEQLLKAIERGFHEYEPDQIDRCLYTILHTRWMIGASTTTNVYDVLTDGGKLAFLSSKTLQKELALLKESFGLSFTYEELQAEFIDNQLSPFLNHYIDRLSVSTGKLEIDSSLYSSSFTTSYDELLASREFSNLLAELITHTNPLLATYRRLNQRIYNIDSLTVQGNPSLERRVLPTN